MYRCQITNKLSKPGEPLHKVIAQTRPKTYTRWFKNEETHQYEERVIGKGFEPVKELSLSLEGETIWNSWTQEEKDLFLKEMHP
jgi:hypothetical protein